MCSHKKVYSYFKEALLTSGVQIALSNFSSGEETKSGANTLCIASIFAKHDGKDASKMRAAPQAGFMQRFLHVNML